VFAEAPPHLAHLSLPERLGVVSPDEVARARGHSRASTHAGPSSSVAQYAPAAAGGYVLLHPPPASGRGSRRERPQPLRSWPAPQPNAGAMQPPVSPTSSFCPPTPSSSISSRSTGTTAASSLYSLPSPTSAHGSFHSARGGAANGLKGSPRRKSSDARASSDSFAFPHHSEVTGLGLEDELAAVEGHGESDRWHVDDYFVHMHTTIRGRERMQRTHAFPHSQVPYRQTYGAETMAG
jgi:hypothetical protein